MTLMNCEFCAYFFVMRPEMAGIEMVKPNLLGQGGGDSEKEA